MVQNLERIQAEARIEAQYFGRLKRQQKFTATIEPTILEAPTHEFPGHLKDVTSVAVAKRWTESSVRRRATVSANCQSS